MDARLALAVGVAREFQRQGLERHLELLRGYYAAVRAGRPAAWSDGHVELLARVLQVPPWEAEFAVRPRGSSCCQGFLARTVMVLGNRTLLRCAGCDGSWLALDETAPLPA